MFLSIEMRLCLAVVHFHHAGFRWHHAWLVLLGSYHLFLLRHSWFLIDRLLNLMEWRSHFLLEWHGVLVERWLAIIIVHVHSLMGVSHVGLRWMPLIWLVGLVVLTEKPFMCSSFLWLGWVSSLWTNVAIWRTVSTCVIVVVEPGVVVTIAIHVLPFPHLALGHILRPRPIRAHGRCVHTVSAMRVVIGRLGPHVLVAVGGSSGRYRRTVGSTVRNVLLMAGKTAWTAVVWLRWQVLPGVHEVDVLLGLIFIVVVAEVLRPASTRRVLRLLLAITRRRRVKHADRLGCFHGTPTALHRIALKAGVHMQVRGGFRAGVNVPPLVRILTLLSRR